MNIRKKIMLCVLIPICLIGIIVIVMAMTKIRGMVIEQVESTLKGTAVATLAAYDQNSGIYIVNDAGEVWKGAYSITASKKVVDTIRDKSGLEVGFFFGDRLIITSALNSEGERISELPVSSKIYEKVVGEGENYFTDGVLIDGTEYYGYFIPVTQFANANNRLGMVFACVDRAETERKVVELVATLIILVALTAVICLLIAMGIATSMSKSLAMSIDNVRKVAAGNLNVTVDERLLAGKDEIGELSKSIEVLQSELHKTLGGMFESTDLLVAEANDLEQTAELTSRDMNNVNAAVNEITSRAIEQAESAQCASNDMQKMADLIIQSGEAAGELNTSADRMRSSGDHAKQYITELKIISTELKQVLTAITEKITTTNESAKNIKEASELISQIASATNLLSLNASIEAARAGEAGRGFAVVATEIQKLSMQSNDAGGRIDEVVNTLMGDFGTVVEATEHMQKVFEKQEVHIDETEDVVGEVMSEIDLSIENIGNIDDKVKQLEVLRANVVKTFTALFRVAEENVASTEETNTVIQYASDRAAGLTESAVKLRGTASALEQNTKYFKMT